MGRKSVLTTTVQNSVEHRGHERDYVDSSAVQVPANGLGIEDRLQFHGIAVVQAAEYGRQCADMIHGQANEPAVVPLLPKPKIRSQGVEPELLKREIYAARGSRAPGSAEPEHCLLQGPFPLRLRRGVDLCRQFISLR